MLTDEFEPKEKHEGLISTRYFVSLPTHRFDAYVKQICGYNLREKSSFSLDDGKLTK